MTAYKDNAETFIQGYKELEQMIRSRYSLKNSESIRSITSKESEFDFCKEELAYLAEVRNLLQHRQKIGDAYPVEPSDELLQYLERVTEKISGRKRCRQIMVPYKEMLIAHREDLVVPLLEKMQKKGFSYIPVFEKGHMEGVFSEKSLCSYIISHPLEKILQELTFDDLKDYISLTWQPHEWFYFAPENMYADKLAEIVEKRYKSGRRIVMIFITANGSRDEKILGIVTPWMLID